VGVVEHSCLVVAAAAFAVLHDMLVQLHNTTHAVIINGLQTVIKIFYSAPVVGQLVSITVVRV